MFLLALKQSNLEKHPHQMTKWNRFCKYRQANVYVAPSLVPPFLSCPLSADSASVSSQAAWLGAETGHFRKEVPLLAKRCRCLCLIPRVFGGPEMQSRKVRPASSV